MKNNLSIETIIEIENIFKKKNWEIEDDVQKFASLFNRFCKRLSIFNEVEQNLILELTQDFLKIGINDFSKLFLKAFNSIPIGLLQSAKKIFIMPIVNYEKKTIKSSHMLWYQLKSYCDYSYEKFFNKVIFYESPEKIKNKNKPETNLFVFIDDYIGTGQTVDEFLELLFATDYNGMIIPRDRTSVLCLIGQNEGINSLKEKNKIVCKSGILRKKGITDKYPDDIAKKYREIMLGIEDELKVGENFHLGYGASESLVSLEIKPPNTTFPVYWHETEKRIAPFPRYKRYKHHENNN